MAAPTYSQLTEMLRVTNPDGLCLNYRHPDGTLRKFRFTDKAYMGIQTKYDFPNAEPIPEELMRLIPTEGGTDEN